MTASIRKIAYTMPKGFEPMGDVIAMLIEEIDNLDIRSERPRFYRGLHYNETKVQIGNGADTVDIGNAAGAVTIGTAAAAVSIGTAEDSVSIGDAARSVKIQDGSKVQSQRVLPTVTIGGRLSVQNVQPLSALSGTTEIDIDAHTVQYGFGAVAYNSGTIVGLDADTLYYIYADDPELDGGAVSYFASATPQDIAAVNGRYFVGSINTPATVDVRTVIGATQASPCVVTLSAGDWRTGNIVTISTALGMVELNGLTTTITRLTPTTARLDGVDSRLWGVYTPSSGIATRSATDQTGSGGAAAGGGGGTVFLGTGF